MSVPTEGRMLREMTAWDEAPCGARDRVRFEVQTRRGDTVTVEARVRPELVEVWVGQHCCGILDRNTLQAWLIARPRTKLVSDDVTFSMDRTVDRGGRVAVTLPDVMAWTLSPDELEMLMDRLLPEDAVVTTGVLGPLGGRTEIMFEVTGGVDDGEVRVWHDESLHFRVGREVLRRWLLEPSAWLMVNGSGFSLDRTADPLGQVAITVLGLGTYLVTPRVLRRLRAWL